MKNREHLATWFIFSSLCVCLTLDPQALEHAIDETFKRIHAVDRHVFAREVASLLREHVANVQVGIGVSHRMLL